MWLPAQWFLRNQQHSFFLTAFYLNFTYLFILIHSVDETATAVLIPFLAEEAAFCLKAAAIHSMFSRGMYVCDIE